jgi:2-methylcitrate dehydratase PrpD
MMAVALLDDQVMPEQYARERIQRRDVQALLRRILVRADPAYSRRFPAEHACRVTVVVGDGRIVSKEKRDYEGFQTRPMSWETVGQKFDRLSAPYAASELRRAITDAVTHLEDLSTPESSTEYGRVFEWYVKNYGPEINLLVDHSQIIQLEALRSGIWGRTSLWGRALTYKG